MEQFSPELLAAAAVGLGLAVALGLILLVRLVYRRAERAAFAKQANAITTAQTERRRAVEERDEMARTVAGLRALNEHLHDQLRERDDAVASAVHEIRTPLTSVQAYAQLMSRNLGAVLRQVEQLDRLIGDLLGQPGGKPLATEGIDLAKEAHDAAQRARVVCECRVDVEVTDEGPHAVRGDRGRVAQVLDNLLRNAVKFSPTNAPIEIRVRRDGGDVIVSVTDHGMGITSDEMPRLFDRYFRGDRQRAQPGEGIGLWVTQQIVMAHNGRIWVSSQGRGRGSTFFVALPVALVEGAPEPLEGSPV